MKSLQIRNIYLVSVLLILSVSSCRKSVTKNDTQELKNADRYYSALSAQKGKNAAFLAMFDPKVYH